MVFINNLIEKYVGRAFEIDCLDIEIHRFQDDTPPLFKGPGIIRGDNAGSLSFKLYNQIPITKDTFHFFKQVQTGCEPESINVSLVAKDYDGIKWHGGWSIPEANVFQLAQVQNFIVHGEFHQLAARIEKVKGDHDKDLTEIVFAGALNLPLSGTIHEKQYHGSEVISTQIWNDHHNLTFKDSSIIFQESDDHALTYITASYHEQFAAPYVENWITEALIFITGRLVYPRMVIRHFENDALVFIRETPKITESGMPPPFSREPQVRECTWEVFLSYLLKSKETRSFDFLQITKGFAELILASTGTLQGFLISLVLYVENCINQIFSEKTVNCNDYRKAVKDIMDHIDKWEGEGDIKKRAKGLLSMLNTPSISKHMDVLIKQGVIREVHKQNWEKARPYLAHGGIIDFSKSEEFWHFRNYFISMAYRLTFRILGYKGKVIDYDDNNFQFVDFKWD